MSERKIALMNFEPKIVNTALMQISQYHKELGDNIEWYNAFKHAEYDKIYCSSLFTFTPKPNWLFTDSRVNYGGTGFAEQLSKQLPPEIAQANYDWSLYPECEYSIIRFSRGCIRNCPFCCVREKEGYIHSVEPKNLNPNGKHVKIMDNNFFANPEWPKAIEIIKSWNQKVEFNQGLDIRLMNEENISFLLQLKHYKQYKFAWDLPEQDLRPKFEWLTQFIKPYKIMVYVLIGFNSTYEQDNYRIDFLHKLGVDPFAMIYNHRQDDPILFHRARHCNIAAIRNSCSFDEYLERKMPKKIVLSQPLANFMEVSES